MLQHSVRQIGGCHVTLFELHSKQTIGISTKRLPVTEIAPTANDLPRDQTDTGGIQQLKEILLPNLSKDNSCDHTGDHTAVNRKTATTGIKYLRQIILIVIPTKYNIIYSRTNHSKYNIPQRKIQIKIRLLPGALCLKCCHQISHHHTKCNDHSIKCNRETTNGNAFPQWCNFYPQMGKSNVRSHLNFSLLYLLCQQTCQSLFIRPYMIQSHIPQTRLLTQALAALQLLSAVEGIDPSWNQRKKLLFKQVWHSFFRWFLCGSKSFYTLKRNNTTSPSCTT